MNPTLFSFLEDVHDAFLVLLISAPEHRRPHMLRQLPVLRAPFGTEAHWVDDPSDLEMRRFYIFNFATNKCLFQQLNAANASFLSDEEKKPLIEKILKAEPKKD
uniref:Exocyst subunit Exo70 family protein n=1 Tax=Steinernema glaseri TaxID=37863 RepID=A0A1I7YPS6_9BILA